MRKRTFIVVYTLATLIVSFVFVPKTALAQLSSNSFRITSDSVNCGGGRSTSDSFAIFSTICEPTDGRTLTSASFVAESGLQYMDDTPFITVSLLDPSNTANTKNAISYGSLTPSSGVASDSILVRVITNAANGYIGSVLSDGALRSGSNEIAAVDNGGTVDGSPSGETGFSVSSSDTTSCTRPSGDNGVTTSSSTFATCTTWKAQSDNTLTFKAAVASGNQSGSYTQALTIIVTGSF